MEPKGLECEQESSSFEDSSARAAKCHALKADSEFSLVLDAWPTLPASARDEILAIVQAAAQSVE
jgi:hypothetical protein